MAGDQSGESPSRKAWTELGEFPWGAREFLRFVQEAMPCGVVMLDAQDVIRLVNPVMLDILGQEAGELLRRRFPDGVRGSGLTALAGYFDRARRDMRPVNTGRLVLAGTRGRGAHLACWLVPLQRDGTYQGMILTADDITAAVKAEEERIGLGLFLKESPQPLLCVSARGRILYANPASAPLLEPFGCAEGTPLPEALRGPLHEVFASGQRQEREIECRDRTFLVALAPIPGLERAHVYGLDITLRKLGEERLRVNEHALSSALSGICMADLETRVCYANPSFFAMWGYTDAGEVLGRSCLNFWESPKTAANIVAELQKRGFWSGELMARRNDGSLFRAQVQASLVRDQAGRALCMLGSFVDITSQQSALDELRESEARFRAIVETGSDLIWETDARGRYSYVSPRITALLGFEPQDVVGQTAAAHMRPGDAENLAQLSHYHAKSGTPFHGVEYAFRCQDGRLVTMERSAQPMSNDYGQFCGFRGMDRDITLRKQALDALQRAHDGLEVRVNERTHALREANEKLEASRARLQAVFSSMGDAVITVDKAFTILQVNEALDVVCARADKLRPGDSLAHAFEPDDSPACLRILRQVVETGEPVRGVRAECRCGVQANQVTMLNASPLWDSARAFIGAVLVVRDITRLDELEKRLDERTRYCNIVGKSRRMQDIYSVLELLTDHKTTVLVLGESGTGKELIVEALHYGSVQITGPLVKVNCASLAESLLESELFGHVRGAFTGAVRDKVGRVQAAEGGTLFLDEIGDLSPNTQLKLLRVLERKEYERVGDSTTHKADVRVVAASNRDLRELAETGQFRKDLYYRLRVMVIEVPPLRDRTEDIPLLTEHFIAKYRDAFGRDFSGVTSEVMDVFLSYPWPGNVRELKHSIEHACILCPGGPLKLRHLPVEFQQGEGGRRPLPAPPEPGEGWRREELLEVLERSRWNKTRASRAMGISRSTLYRKMAELGIAD